MARRFGDDPSEICQLCNKEITAGHTVYVFQGYAYCSQRCAKAHKGISESNEEITEEYLMTAEEKEFEWGYR